MKKDDIQGNIGFVRQWNIKRASALGDCFTIAAMSNKLDDTEKPGFPILNKNLNYLVEAGSVGFIFSAAGFPHI